MKKSLLLTFASLLFISCASVKTEKTAFNGMIYDGNNEPVAGVQISIDGKQKTVSDMYGRFYIENLSVSNEYTLTASKKDYETINIAFEFQNITEVAYLTMYSAPQLLTEAEKNLQENNIENAQDFLTRAEECSGKTLSSQYLQAVIYYKQTNFTDAIKILNEISVYGDSNPYIYLFLADIYEYELKDTENAKKFLSKYLEVSSDSDVEKRYKKLCAQ